MIAEGNVRPNKNLLARRACLRQSVVQPLDLSVGVSRGVHEEDEKEILTIAEVRVEGNEAEPGLDQRVVEALRDERCVGFGTQPLPPDVGAESLRLTGVGVQELQRSVHQLHGYVHLVRHKRNSSAADATRRKNSVASARGHIFSF